MARRNGKTWEYMNSEAYRQDQLQKLKDSATDGPRPWEDD